MINLYDTNTYKFLYNYCSSLYVLGSPTNVEGLAVVLLLSWFFFTQTFCGSLTLV